MCVPISIMGGGEKYPFIKGGMEGEGQKTNLRVLVLG